MKMNETTGNTVASPIVVDPRPISPADSTLGRLPIEIFQTVCQFLEERNDLLALRRVDRFCRSCTTLPLAPQLHSKLQTIRVLTTEEGLKTILGITAIPEWRNRIRCVEFVDPGLDALRYAKQAHDTEKIHRWFGYFKIVSPHLETIVDKVRTRQLSLDSAFAVSQKDGKLTCDRLDLHSLTFARRKLWVF